MENKVKNIVVTSVFVLFIAFFAAMCIYCYFNPVAESTAERRPLAQFPDEITWDGVVDKTVINEFEDYSVDQFPFREFFRGLKARFQWNVLQLSENNGLAIEDGYIVEIKQNFTQSNVDYSIDRLKFWYDKFVKDNGGDHYLTLIPDKNYFFAQDKGSPAPDYEKLEAQLKEALSGMEYVDIFDSLELDDYYLTDTHWSQDKIGGVVETLAEAMGIKDRLSGKYTENKLEGFKGVYYEQTAINPDTELLVYLTNEILDACEVLDYTNMQKGGIYNLEMFSGNDGYNMFLSGSKGLLKITNPNATTDETLVVFRDSYGSSLTPLLVEAYKTIYVVDIRYCAPELLQQYINMKVINFKDADVLFAYSALILDNRNFLPINLPGEAK